MTEKKKALISVSNKSGLDKLLESLTKHNYEFISTGGTAKFIKDAGYKVTEVSEITEFKEMLDGRVKTLHPKIHAGILANRELPEHLKALEENGINQIDMVIVNLYPFEENNSIENIDVGGPTMLRAAAKNFKSVAVLCDPSQYESLIENLEENRGETSEDFRKSLAQACFTRTAHYDSLISKALSNGSRKVQSFTLPGSFKTELRYGENPHQKAALFSNPLDKEGVANAEQLQGKKLSYNNIVDIDAAWKLVLEFDKSVPCVAIIKHTNPCGVAISPTVTEAFREAFICDSTSAFGGIVASNSTIDLDAANEMTQIFLEAIIAPDFTKEALEILATKKNLRVLKAKASDKKDFQVKNISGGFLIQEEDSILVDPKKLNPVTKKQITEEEWVDLIFAWKVVKHVKSNAIVTALDGRTLGIGVGQTNRVAAVEHALKNFDLDTRGAVLASDAFFPFADSIDLAAQNHISAIIQPGGSIKDDEVIKACDDLGIAMIFTGHRHFKH